MDPDPARRPRDAGAVAAAVTAWLDGERRREQALRRVEGAAPLQVEAARLREEAARLRRLSQGQLSALSPRAPVEDKAAAWAMEERAATLEREATITETQWLQAVQGALGHDAALPEAHAALADHYQRHMAEAEARRDPSDSVRYELLLRAHDRGRHAAWLSGDGVLSLTTDPPDALVEVYRVVPVQRRLAPVLERRIARSPFADLRLPAGSWVLRVSADGCQTLDLPVLIERGARWDGVRPGDADARPLRLPREGELSPDERLVPAGWAWLGGDDGAIDPLPRRRWWVDGLVMTRVPITNAEYCAFLEDLAAAGRPDEARRLAPAEAGTRSAEPIPLMVPGPDGRYKLGVDGKGEPLLARGPVVQVQLAGAVAYARWRAARDGLPWRLPHDHEWEKAARGVDGRHFPWGDHFDPSWAVTMASHAGAAARAPVDACPADEGPYGVRGMAGNVRDWCWNGYEREGPGEGGLLVVADQPAGEGYVMVRGGSYIAAENHSRAGSRIAARLDDRMGTLGFRLARPWPGDIG